MRDVLGFELSSAARLLEAEGMSVSLVETRSRKGVDGNEKRVVRARQTGDSAVELTWALFKTDVGFVGAQTGEQN